MRRKDKPLCSSKRIVVSCRHDRLNMYVECWVDKAGGGRLAVRVDGEEDIKMILDFGLKQLDR